MSVTLSRIQLNPYSQRAMILASDQTKLHERLYSLFEKEQCERILFRVDTDQEGPTVLLQSKLIPNWDQLCLGPHDLRSAPASKQVEMSFALGAELSFRLMARTTRSESPGQGNGRSKRRDLRTDEERLEWLSRKGKDSGFRVTTCALTMLSLAAIKSDKPFGERGSTFAAVRFDGELVVTDPEKLSEAVEKGIGIQKAFGFGLLSLGQVR